MKYAKKHIKEFLRFWLVLIGAIILAVLSVASAKVVRSIAFWLMMLLAVLLASKTSTPAAISVVLFVIGAGLLAWDSRPKNQTVA